MWNVENERGGRESGALAWEVKKMLIRNWKFPVESEIRVCSWGQSEIKVVMRWNVYKKEEGERVGKWDKNSTAVKTKWNEIKYKIWKYKIWKFYRKKLPPIIP
jgi:hypothetical protein